MSKITMLRIYDDFDDRLFEVSLEQLKNYPLLDADKSKELGLEGCELVLICKIEKPPQADGESEYPPNVIFSVAPIKETHLQIGEVILNGIDNEAFIDNLKAAIAQEMKKSGEEDRSDDPLWYGTTKLETLKLCLASDLGFEGSLTADDDFWQLLATELKPFIVEELLQHYIGQEEVHQPTQKPRGPKPH